MTLTHARISLVTLALGLLSGCGHPYTVRPTEITVTQFQNNQPAPDLEVKVLYSAWLFVDDVPQDAAGKTDSQGKVILPVADFKKGAVNLKIGDPWTYFAVSPEVARRGGEAVEHGDEPAHEYRVTLKPAAK